MEKARLEKYTPFQVPQPHRKSLVGLGAEPRFFSC